MGELRFYRPKVGKTQTHKLTKDAVKALREYMPHAPALGALLRGSLKSGQLSDPGMTRDRSPGVWVSWARPAAANLSAA